MARCRKAHTRDKRTRKAGECVLRYVQARAGANVITTFDYVIVGAGSAGCVLANRLSADPDAQILLIEAGGPDKHPFIRMPRALARVMGKPDYIWPFTTQPEHQSNDTGEFWTRGRTLGGSSAINGMMYVRGHAFDFEDLATVAGPDWNWSSVGAAYKALESHELGAGSTRGDRGPLHISLPVARSALSDDLISACTGLGMRRTDDVNDPSPEERVGYAQWTIYRGRRQSAAEAFLKPVRARSNLTIQTHLTVDKVLFDGRRATGVQCIGQAGAMQFMARRDVILCAGTLASPAILQRSGVGPAAHLSQLGIRVVADNQAIGANLREHRGIVMQWSAPDQASENRDYRGAALLASVAKYFIAHRGPMTKAAFDIGAWFKSRPDLARPDGQILLSPFSFDYTSATPRVEAGGGVICCLYMLRPQSSGSVQVKSADPTALPAITPNYGSVESDNALIVDMMRYVRRLAAQPVLAPYGLKETRPGPQFESDAELREAHRKMGYTNYHAVGTCRMGHDADSALDPKLNVRGVSGLRVVDASIFPFMPAGNTNGPVMAAAWRAAELIRARATP
jgi:choline dehydrogenase-like flavoprotein